MSSFRTQIVFCGLNIGCTLNKLSRKYMLFDVERQGTKCKITVDTTVAKQIVAYLEEKCYNVVEIRKLGASCLSEIFQRHFVLFALLAVGLIVLAVSSEFCWKIQIVGDYSEGEVASALQSFGVQKGCSLRSFDADVLENRLAVKLDAMYAVVHRKGSALYVNVVKKKQADSPVDLHSRRDVVASCGGVVVELFCEQGTPIVAVGDSVNKGDVLISGQRIFNDGTSEDVYALGKVVLLQSCSAFAEFDGTVTETVDTGRTFCANDIWLFGKNYGRKPSFSSYRTERETVSLFPLNINVERVVYHETQNVTRSAQLSERLDDLKKQALQQATEQATFQIKYVVFKVENQGVTAIVFGETQIN